MKVRSLLASACTLALGAALAFPLPSLAASPSLAQLKNEHPVMQHTLRPGDSGHLVCTLQDDLKLDGFPGVGPTTGTFGSRTEREVLAFQRDNQLTATGVVNAATWQDILAQLGLAPYYWAGEREGASQGVARSAAANITASSQGGSGSIAGRSVVAVYHMIATAYGPSYHDNYPFGPVDAFGHPLKRGDIAVDPSIIPLHSSVYVKGYTDTNLPQGGFLGHAVDTGGAIQGHRIDIFMNAGAVTVSNFGIEPVTVDLLGK